jgi:acid stress-induced BolA-like protein IbaG/YrbA
MMHPDEIKAIIAAGLPCERIDVAGDGDHFEALVVSAGFAGKNRVQRQQTINALLREHFDSGKLHALSMKTMTPQEWSASRG